MSNDIAADILDALVDYLLGADLNLNAEDIIISTNVNPAKIKPDKAVVFIMPVHDSGDIENGDNWQKLGVVIGGLVKVDPSKLKAINEYKQLKALWRPVHNAVRAFAKTAKSPTLVGRMYQDPSGEIYRGFGDKDHTVAAWCGWTIEYIDTGS